MFNRDEIKDARRLKKIVIKHSNNKGEEILFNVIYMSTATKVSGDENFYASEEPGASYITYE